MKPNDFTHKLTPKQQLALPLLLVGMSSADVSEKINVTAGTVSEWLHHSPPFRHALDAARQEIRDRARDSINSLVSVALAGLVEVLNNSSSETNKIKAIEIVLTKLMPGIKQEGLDMTYLGGSLR